MMFISYIILAYNHPKQVKRLVERLRTPNTFFYIHIDKKSDIVPFQASLPQSENVKYVRNEDRVDCRWGDLSLVHAVFAAFKIIIPSGKDGFVVLLSGQDYPIRSNQYIFNFFKEHSNNDFLSIYPIPDPKKKTENGGEERFKNYTFDCYNPLNSRMKAKIRPLSFNKKTIAGFLRLACYRRGLLPFAFKLWFKPRKYPACLAKVFNEFWFALRYDTVRYILDFWDNHPELEEFYQWTHIPDETVFGSILCADKIHKAALLPMCHLIDWDNVNNGSPKTFRIHDIEYIDEMKKKKDYILFARKFEEDDDILNILDRENLDL